MSDGDFRRVMSVVDFESIPIHDDEPIEEYYVILIDENERIDARFFESAEGLEELTPGQRMLIQLGTFDGQVKNGGITQFFWNHAESIFDVLDWIESLDFPELQSNYEQAVQTLVGNKERWLAAREEWARAGVDPDWEAFRKTYGMLDLGWFDKAYFDKHGYDEDKNWVRQSRGLHFALQIRMVEYIKAHRDELVVSALRCIMRASLPILTRSHNYRLSS